MVVICFPLQILLPSYNIQKLRLWEAVYLCDNTPSVGSADESVEPNASLSLLPLEIGQVQSMMADPGHNQSLPVKTRSCENLLMIDDENDGNLSCQPSIRHFSLGKDYPARQLSAGKKDGPLILEFGPDVMSSENENANNSKDSGSLPDIRKCVSNETLKASEEEERSGTLCLAAGSINDINLYAAEDCCQSTETRDCRQSGDIEVEPVSASTTSFELFDAAKDTADNDKESNSPERNSVDDNRPMTADFSRGVLISAAVSKTVTERMSKISVHKCSSTSDISSSLIDGGFQTAKKSGKIMTSEDLISVLHQNCRVRRLAECAALVVDNKVPHTTLNNKAPASDPDVLSKVQTSSTGFTNPPTPIGDTKVIWLLLARLTLV